MSVPFDYSCSDTVDFHQSCQIFIPCSFLSAIIPNVNLAGPQQGREQAPQQGPSHICSRLTYAAALTQQHFTEALTLWWCCSSHAAAFMQHLTRRSEGWGFGGGGSRMRAAGDEECRLQHQRSDRRRCAPAQRRDMAKLAISAGFSYI